MTVQTSPNVDILLNSNDHISVVRDATVTWLGKLIVFDELYVDVTLTRPRSRSRSLSI